MKKKVLIGVGSLGVILTIALLCGVFWFCDMIDNSLSKKEIFALVQENYAVIMEDVREKDFSDTEKIEGIKKIYSDTEIIDVYCGGTGIGSAANYYGFYYSPDGQPKAVYYGSSFGKNPKLQSEKNGFCIKNSNGDNCYYTEKIKDNFYYYEAHF